MSWSWNLTEHQKASINSVINSDYGGYKLKSFNVDNILVFQNNSGDLKNVLLSDFIVKKQVGGELNNYSETSDNYLNSVNKQIGGELNNYSETSSIRSN